jgi:hypothetical protein
MASWAFISAGFTGRDDPQGHYECHYQ